MDTEFRHHEKRTSPTHPPSASKAVVKDDANESTIMDTEFRHHAKPTPPSHPPTASKAIVKDDDNDEQDIPCLDEKETTSFDIPDFDEKHIILPTLEELEKKSRAALGVMHTKPLADGKPPIDLSVLTKHLVPPQYIGEDEDDVTVVSVLHDA